MALADLRALAADAGVDFVRVEPTARSPPDGCRGAGRGARGAAVQPDCTVINDVTLDGPGDRRGVRLVRATQLAQRPQEGARGGALHAPEDIEILLGHLEEVVARTGMRPHSDDYFRTVSRVMLFGPQVVWFIVVRHEGVAVGSLFYYQANQQMMFAHSALVAGGPSRARSTPRTRSRPRRLLAHREGDRWLTLRSSAWGAPRDAPVVRVYRFQAAVWRRAGAMRGDVRVPGSRAALLAYRLALRVRGCAAIQTTSTGAPGAAPTPASGT